MDNLLKDSINSYYWVGFLLADGYFDTKHSRIILSLSNLDLEHLKKFLNFVESNNISIDKKHCHASLQNIDQFKFLIEKFNINNRKTYVPVDFELFKKFDKKLIYSLIIGFIDGDGCIRKQQNRKDCALSIHLHISWLKNLNFIENFIYDYFNVKKNKILSKIGNDGYSRLIISNNNILNKMKKEIISLNIPYMERKWNKINENTDPKSIIFEKHKENIINLYNSGKTPIEIIKILNLKQGIVYKHIKEQKKLVIVN